MFVRLLLALLLVSFAVPAAAAAPMCHAEPAMAGMHHDAPAAPDRPSPAHVCVGCVPLAEGTATRVLPRILPSPPPPGMHVATLDLGRGIAPALPPPRPA